MLSKSFWGIFNRNKTQKFVTQVYEELQIRGVYVDIDKAIFGKESEEIWLHFKLFKIIKLDEGWFEKIKNQIFESEIEVSVFFLSSLFQYLGYAEEDFSFEHKIKLPVKWSNKMKSGRKGFSDLIIFNGNNRSSNNALVIVESKNFSGDPKKDKESLTNAATEARMYDLYFNAQLLVSTNGHDINIFAHSQKDTPANPTMSLHRSELKERWSSLGKVRFPSANDITVASRRSVRLTHSTIHVPCASASQS